MGSLLCDWGATYSRCAVLVYTVYETTQQAATLSGTTFCASHLNPIIVTFIIDSSELPRLKKQYHRC